MKKKSEGARFCLRLLFTILGLVLCACGTGLSLHCARGAAPILALAAVAELELGSGLIWWLLALMGLAFLVEILLLGKAFRPRQLLQLPAAALFSLGTVLVLEYTAFIAPPKDLWISLLYVLIGAALFGLGAWLCRLANLAPLPAEALAEAAAEKRGWRDCLIPGLVRDLLLALIAAGLSLLLFGKLRAVREGTLFFAAAAAFVPRLAEQAFGEELRGLLAPEHKEDEKHG